MRGRLDVREIEDIGDTALSYAEVKALASGDPRILEKAQLDTEKVRLDRLQRAWTRNQRALQATISSADSRQPVLAAQLAQLENSLGRRRDTRGDAFSMTIAGRAYTSRADAATELARELATIDPTYRDIGTRPVAQLGGLDLQVNGRRLPEPHLLLELAGVPGSGLTLSLAEAGLGRPGLITRLENRVAAISATHSDVQQTIQRLSTERARAAAELGHPFPHAEALAAATTRSAQLDAELAEQARRNHTPATAPEQWQAAVAGLADGQRIIEDPQWAALAATLTRLLHPDYDVAACLAQLAVDPPLDRRHPAADLHDRVLQDYLRAVPQVPQAADRGPVPPEQPPSPYPVAGGRGVGR